jgi:hypothetical protein
MQSLLSTTYHPQGAVTHMACNDCVTALFWQYCMSLKGRFENGLISCIRPQPLCRYF